MCQWRLRRNVLARRLVIILLAYGKAACRVVKVEAYDSSVFTLCRTRAMLRNEQ